MLTVKLPLTIKEPSELYNGEKVLQLPSLSVEFLHLVNMKYVFSFVKYCQALLACKRYSLIKNTLAIIIVHSIQVKTELV